MRVLFILIVTFTLFFTFKIDAQNVSSADDKSITLHIPDEVNTEKLEITYFITGSFGGIGDFVRINPKMRDYKIPKSFAGKPIETLKLIVFSPNYETQTFDFPNLIEQHKDFDLKFETLRTIPFSGKILLPNQLNTAETEVKINYSPDWECDFFQLSDCLIRFSVIEFADVAKDGRFTINLPDFADDKTIASFGETGKFRFSLQNKQTGKTLFSLKPEDKLENFGGIPATTNYQRETIFIQELEK